MGPAVIASLLGMVLGQWVRAQVRPDMFRTCFFLASLLLGAHLVLRAVLTAATERRIPFSIVTICKA
jgi:uncharacterized membrane protein YfcA